MATAYIDVNKEDKLEDLAVTATGGTVTNDVRVSFLDSLTPEEIVLSLQKISEKIIATGKLT